MKSVISKIAGRSLFEISQLAKRNPQNAAGEILTFVQKNFPDLVIESVKINSSKVSLNSVNGFLKTKNQEFFFKFHSEENEEQTLSEYYQGQVLEKAGLPVISPLLVNTRPGEQFLIYEKITAPTVFDEFSELDGQFLEEGKYDEAQKKLLLQAEADFLEKESAVYLSSLSVLPAVELGKSPLHQLFSARLLPQRNSTPRLDLFYSNAEVVLPAQHLSFSALSRKHWTINGVEYQETLSEIIAAAKKLLQPASEGLAAAVLGHGDDHNGNKFLIGSEFRLFDPAFAGWHPALLSFVKATVHNTFVHPFWLYDPERIEGRLNLDYRLTESDIVVEHDLRFSEAAPLRQEILELQAAKIWRPLLNALREKKLLPENWREYLRKAFFCCPFLVYNLLDAGKYSPQASLLALSKCVELGSASQNENFVDNFFNSL